MAYTGQLNWFLPKATIPALAILATCAETILAILLVLGWRTRIAAVLSGVLLLSFAVTMTGALGIKAPLDFSVFSAAGGAFLLAGSTEYPFSVDHLRRIRFRDTVRRDIAASRKDDGNDPSKEGEVSGK